MRRLQSVLLAGLTAAILTIGLANPSAATPTPFYNATLSTKFPNLTPVVVSGATAVTAVGVSRNAGGVITQLTVPKSLFQTQGFLLPVTDPAAAPIAGILVTESNATGMFTHASGKLAGPMPLVGVNKVCLFAPCTAGPPANLVVPIGVVGLGGAVTVSQQVNITALGAPWTVGTAAVGSVSITGFVKATALPTSMHGPGTAIELVTPIFVSTNIGASAVVPVFSSLNLVVPSPEPGIGAACGAAIAMLLVMGRRRMHKS
jgi:hypothetical protein